jgi:hypothetical protein
MALIYRWSQHVRAHCVGDDCEGCFLCEGGLLLCTVCGGAESSAPTECPGRVLTQAECEWVSDGRVDFTVKRGWHDPRVVAGTITGRTPSDA